MSSNTREELNLYYDFYGLKHARSELQQYEEKLHLVKNFKKRQILVKKIKSLTKNEKVLNLIEDIINTENEGGQNE